MIRILFVCHGNICRSPMAEYYMKDQIEKKGLSQHFSFASAAVSTEEIYRGIGNPVYPPAKAKLYEHGIECRDKRARLMTASDYEEYDLLIGMDNSNLSRMRSIVGNDEKLHLLLDFTDHPRDVADPWYTDDFDATWDDIEEGCDALIKLLSFDQAKEKLVLASGSPRRRELLSQIGIDYILDPSHDEEHTKETKPELYVEDLSRQKAEAVMKRHKENWILGADTVVSLGGSILGKPRDEADAARMLRMLSGHTHQVYTGVTLLRTFAGQVIYQKTLSVCTDVTFYPLTDEDINAYIRTGEPMDKAGAYGIQGKGAVLVSGIRGDYDNVVGLPVSMVHQVLYC